MGLYGNAGTGMWGNENVKPIPAQLHIIAYPTSQLLEIA